MQKNIERDVCGWILKVDPEGGVLSNNSSATRLSILCQALKEVY